MLLFLLCGPLVLNIFDSKYPICLLRTPGILLKNQWCRWFKLYAVSNYHKFRNVQQNVFYKISNHFNLTLTVYVIHFWHGLFCGPVTM